YLYSLLPRHPASTLFPYTTLFRSGWRDGSERLCQETDESSTHYNKRHTSSASGVSALRPRQPHGRRTRVGSIRSIFRRSRSAKADRKSTRLNSSHVSISYAVFCLK